MQTGCALGSDGKRTDFWELELVGFILQNHFLLGKPLTVLNNIPWGCLGMASAFLIVERRLWDRDV